MQALASGIASRGERGAGPSGGFGVAEINACSQGHGCVLPAAPRSSSTCNPPFSDTHAPEIVIFWCLSISPAVPGQHSWCWSPQAVAPAPPEVVFSPAVQEQVGKRLWENIQESDGMRDSLCRHTPVLPLSGSVFLLHALVPIHSLHWHWHLAVRLCISSLPRCPGTYPFVMSA